MNTDTTPNGHPDPSAKGKGRSQDLLEATERTPLLEFQSHRTLEDPENITQARRSLWSKLTLVFFASLGFCVVFFALLALVAYKYAARVSTLSTEDILDHALVVNGPDRVDVLNVTDDGGLWVNIVGRVGIDGDAVISLSKEKASWPDFLDALARWGIRKLDHISVNLSTIYLSPEHDNKVILATVDTPWLELPITTDPSDDLSWLTRLSVPIFVSPTTNVSALVQYVRDAWRTGFISARANVDQVSVQGGSARDTSWRQGLKIIRSNVQTSVRMQIPPVPGFPTPGRDAPLPDISDLITLQGFNISTNGRNVSLYASATIIDPAPPTFNLTSPTVPFIVSFPASPNSQDNQPHPVASINSHPFTLTHPNISILLSGVVLPLTLSSVPLLSTFVSAYLSGKSNPIIISTPLLPGHSIDFIFPALIPKPNILKNVTIHDMTIKPYSPFLASGTVFVRAVLPKGMNIDLNVNRVLPDVLVFDGEAPNSSDDASFELSGQRDGDSPPLPDPIPERAFAHIRPHDWLASVSEPETSEEGEGSTYAVTAKFVDVPLEVLPGRQKAFSEFVRKAIFTPDGALAGILGSAAVAVQIHGLPVHNGTGGNPDIELKGLPVKGTVRVGKGSLLRTVDD